jgi:CRP-like cAMP-binding protein
MSETNQRSREQRLRANAILAKLPEGEFGKISERVELIELDLREQVYQPGQAIHQVYFPTSAVFSLMAVGDEQASVEVATVGVEGMVGLPLFLGANTTPHAGFCQIPGQAARMNATDLRAALSADGQLHRLLNRFVHATIVQIAQNVVCNNSHSVEQRAARWLLTTRDRVNGDQFPLTQEFLAQMLGVRRPTVSDTAGRLQDRGLIQYRRGIITILDRAGLEALACPCYQVVRAEFDDLVE